MDPYPRELEADLVSRDGAPIRIRPIRPDDGPGLMAFHEALSSGTVYFRFFRPHPHLSDAEVERFTQVDYRDRLALVIEDQGAMVAVGRFERISGTDEAEVAFVVADEWQHRGLGTILLHRLAEAAAARGIGRFTADTLADNSAMIGVFRDAGFDVHFTRDSGTVRVTFPIGPC